MLDLDRLKQTLVESGKLKPERIAEAETFAREQNVPFTRALTSQLMIGFTDLGACCSAVTGLPYVSLPTESEPPDAARLFSPDCVRAWQMFPLAFDASTHALTIAVHDPDQIPRLERLNEFLMQPHRLAFTIAAESEIERAYSRYYDTESAQTRIAKFVHRDSKTKASLPATPEAPVKPVKSGKTKPAPAAPPNRDEHQPDYAAMSQALIGAATLLVRQQFDAEPDRIHGVRGCVRYCQLLASRLRFTPAQADALVLAAWLSVLGDRPGVIQRLAAPYKLESVLLPGTTGVGRVASHRPEALVLGLVKAHQTLKSQEPDICRDVNLIRRRAAVALVVRPAAPGDARNVSAGADG